jgi:hypothetical protein
MAQYDINMTGTIRLIIVAQRRRTCSILELGIYLVCCPGARSTLGGGHLHNSGGPGCCPTDPRMGMGMDRPTSCSTPAPSLMEYYCTCISYIV